MARMNSGMNRWLDVEQCKLEWRFEVKEGRRDGWMNKEEHKEMDGDMHGVRRRMIS